MFDISIPAGMGGGIQFRAPPPHQDAVLQGPPPRLGRGIRSRPPPPQPAYGGQRPFRRPPPPLQPVCRPQRPQAPSGRGTQFRPPPPPYEQLQEPRPPTDIPFLVRFFLNKIDSYMKYLGAFETNLSHIIFPADQLQASKACENYFFVYVLNVSNNR